MVEYLTCTEEIRVRFTEGPFCTPQRVLEQERAKLFLPITEIMFTFSLRRNSGVLIIDWMSRREIFNEASRKTRINSHD